MRTGSTIFGSIRKPAGASLLVLVISWMSLLPLLEAAHFTFADHDHIFCLEHNRIEDIPRRAAPFATTSDPGWTSSHPAREPWSHDPCSVLAVVIAPGVLDAFQPASLLLAVSEAELLAPATRQPPPRGRGLLLDAPKTSPPLA